MSTNAYLKALLHQLTRSSVGRFTTIHQPFPATLPQSGTQITPRNSRSSQASRTVLYRSSKHTGSDVVKGIVYHSVATDIFTNLSFEDWVYNNLDLSRSEVLMLWYNDPCIVIGRHQNPWAECNHQIMAGSKVNLARRRSGGGTVYHDDGNLNCTFFTSRGRYNRPRNLNTIISAIKRRWPDVDVEATCRDDIVLNRNFKISGSASKMGRDIAYHHCTLLHSCDKQRLADLLNVSTNGISHKATPSVPSGVKNLGDVDASIDHQTLVQAIADEFYRTREPLDQPQIYDIDPSNQDVWPGIHGYREELKSWKWVYGKTPPFSVQRSDNFFSVVLHITGGAVSGLVVTGVSDDAFVITSIQQLSARLKGVRFTRDDIQGVCDHFLKETRLSGDQKAKLSQICSLVEDAVS